MSKHSALVLQLMIIYRFVFGFCRAVFNSALVRFMAEQIPLSKRGRYAGLVEVSFGLSSLIGFTIVGYILSSLGVHAPFLIVGVTFAPAALLLIMLVRAGEIAAAQIAPAAHRAADLAADVALQMAAAEPARAGWDDAGTVGAAAAAPVTVAAIASTDPTSSSAARPSQSDRAPFLQAGQAHKRVEQSTRAPNSNADDSKATAVTVSRGDEKSTSAPASTQTQPQTQPHSELQRKWTYALHFRRCWEAMLFIFCTALAGLRCCGFSISQHLFLVPVQATLFTRTAAPGSCRNLT